MSDTDLARFAAALADPTRSRIALALLDGRARTATELALAAEVAPSTASHHLSVLLQTGLLTLVKQGRHRYHQLADARIANALETLLQVAASSRPATLFGPEDRALREARVCYDHLAGTLGVQLCERLLSAAFVQHGPDDVTLTAAGLGWAQHWGITLPPSGRRPRCRLCLDWSERRMHLAGAFGAALLDGLLRRGWLRRRADSRALLVDARARRFVQTLGAD